MKENFTIVTIVYEFGLFYIVLKILVVTHLLINCLYRLNFRFPAYKGLFDKSLMIQDTDLKQIPNVSHFNMKFDHGNTISAVLFWRSKGPILFEMENNLHDTWNDPTWSIARSTLSGNRMDFFIHRSHMHYTLEERMHFKKRKIIIIIIKGVHRKQPRKNSCNLRREKNSNGAIFIYINLCKEKLS